MLLVTDMTHRERKRYIVQIESHIKACSELVNSLQESDDTKAILSLINVTLGGRFVNELVDIFREAQHLNIPDSPPIK